METLTLKRAKELSVLKWKDLAQSGSLTPSNYVHDIIVELDFGCGLCEYYGKLNGDPEYPCRCVGCPLKLEIEKGCCGGLYNKWLHTPDRKELAAEILALIESINTEE